MNNRQKQIIKTLLEALSDREGLCSETVIHGMIVIKLGERVTLNEFEEALRFCDSQRWLTSLRSELNTLLWKINSNGRAALSEL
ncbi:MAG TPA: hypothetical protein VN281_09805 [Verrucomicrobiae bacterium]|jgi:hypothetical protein|nr:hypothetical protein [Verrucomicrobiae bacterium]